MPGPFGCTPSSTRTRWRSSYAIAAPASIPPRSRRIVGACASRSSAGWSARAAPRKSGRLPMVGPRSASRSAGRPRIGSEESRDRRAAECRDRRRPRAVPRRRAVGARGPCRRPRRGRHGRGGREGDPGGKARRGAPGRPHAGRGWGGGDPPRRRAAQRFLALSVSDAAEDVIAIIRAGARGYVTKSISGPELADAIERVRDGDAVFSPRLAGFVLDAFAGTGAPAPSAVDPELDQLTAREREVLQHIARGYLYKEIGARLHISAKTVEAHVSAVLRKLQLSNRHELSRWAVERRLVD